MYLCQTSWLVVVPRHGGCCVISPSREEPDEARRRKAVHTYRRSERLGGCNPHSKVTGLYSGYLWDSLGQAKVS